MGFCSDYSSGRSLRDDGECGIDGSVYRTEVYTTLCMVEDKVAGVQKLDGINEKWISGQKLVKHMMEASLRSKQ